VLISLTYAFEPFVDIRYYCMTTHGQCDAGVRTKARRTEACQETGDLRAHGSTVPAAPPIWLPIPNPDPKTHHNPRDVNKAGSFKAKSLKAKSLNAKARSLKTRPEINAKVEFNSYGL